MVTGDITTPLIRLLLTPFLSDQFFLRHQNNGHTLAKQCFSLEWKGGPQPFPRICCRVEFTLLQEMWALNLENWKMQTRFCPELHVPHQNLAFFRENTEQRDMLDANKNYHGICILYKHKAASLVLLKFAGFKLNTTKYGKLYIFHTFKLVLNGKSRIDLKTRYFQYSHTFLFNTFLFNVEDWWYRDIMSIVPCFVVSHLEPWKPKAKPQHNSHLQGVMWYPRSRKSGFMNLWTPHHGHIKEPMRSKTQIICSATSWFRCNRCSGGETDESGCLFVSACVPRYIQL